MISVIIPVYNVERYLEECLNSIQHQTYTDIEVILVNDGSTEYLWENIYFLWIVMMLLRLIF